MKHTFRFHRALVLSLLLSQFFVTMAVRAQEPTEPPEYRQVIREALSEYHAKNFPEARALFSDAHALYPNARTLRGLGMTAFELRSYRESIGYLKEALASQVKPLDGGLRNETERLLKRAERFVAKLNLTVEPANARVLVDNEPTVPKEGEPIVLEVGEHTLDFQADGYVGETRTFHVKGREVETWRILLNPVPPPPVAPEPVATAPDPREAAETVMAEDEEAAPTPAYQQTRERPKKRPLYKNPWLWTGVGVVVVGAAVTAGVLAARDSEVAPIKYSDNMPVGGVFSTLQRR